VGIFLIAVLLVIWFSFQQSESELQKLNSIWRSEGFAEKNLTDNFNSLMLLSEEKIEKIKSKIDNYDSDDKSVKSVTSIYSNYLVIVLEMKKLDELQKITLLEKEPCRKISIFKETKEGFAKASNKIVSFQEKLNLFVESNPTESAELNLNQIYFDNSNLELFINDSQDLILLLEANC